MRSRISRFSIALIGLAMLGLPAHAAAPANGLTITPSSDSITADDSRTFLVKTTNTDGTTTDVTSAATLSINDPLGSLTAATYHAGKIGTWTVIATYQSFTATAKITVSAGALVSLDINPNSDPEVVTLGKTTKFSAEGFDAHNNKVTGSSVTWSVIGDVGSIDQSGVFTPVKTGSGRVQVTSGSVIDTINVTVKEAPATNTNSSTNTNTSTTTNSNVNRTTNTNTTATNTNTGATTNSNANTNTSGTTTTNTSSGLQCTTLKSWLWVLLLVAFLAAVWTLYTLVPVTKWWPVLLALIGAAVLAIVQRKYGCSMHAWWAWVMILGTVGISLYHLQNSRPGTKPQ